MRLCSDIEELVTPYTADYAHHVYHIYAVRVPRRDEIIANRSPKWVSPVAFTIRCPIHLQHAYQSLEYEIGAFPIAERAAHQFISLPMFPELTSGQIEIVIKGLKEAVANCALA